MAAYMGKDGDVQIGTAVVAYMDSWTLNADINSPEVTGYGDAARAYGSAIRGWNVSFSGTLDRSDTDQADLLDQFEDGTLADIAIRLYTIQNSSVGGTTEYWSGNLRMTSHSVNAAISDKVSLSFNGNGNGDLTYTTLST